MAVDTFFSSTTKRPNHTKQPGLISLNGHAQLACALYVVDFFLSPVNQQHDFIATQILINLYKYSPDCPRLKQDKLFLRPAKYLQALCFEQTKPQAKRTFIERLAITLNHLVITHVLNHPQLYSPLLLSNTNPLLDLAPWMAQALAELLKLEIIELKTQDNKKLAQQACYFSSSANPRYLLLHRQGNEWKMSAMLEHFSWFESLQTGPEISPPTIQPDLVEQYNQFVHEAKNKATQHKAILLEQYNDHLERWDKWVSKQKWSEEELINYYIEILPLTHTISQEEINSFHTTSLEQSCLKDQLIQTLAALATYRLISCDITQKMHYQSHSEYEPLTMQM